MLTETGRPRLLMISHCLPRRKGSAAQRRAWDLLTTAAEACEVWLATAANGPVNLVHWRDLKAHAQQVCLAGRSITIPQAKALRQAVTAWSGKTTFDATLCTQPSLWWAAELVETPVRLCDTADAPDALAARWRLWLDRVAPRSVRSAPRTALLTDEVNAAPAPWAHRYVVPADAPHALHRVLARLRVTRPTIRRAA